MISLINATDIMNYITGTFSFECMIYMYDIKTQTFSVQEVCRFCLN